MLILDTWKKWNIEFIEAFHLIEGSLYEGEESRRLNALDKSLDVILDETYEKMLHYAHNLQNPITMLHMLGIILPILGLVIFAACCQLYGRGEMVSSCSHLQCFPDNCCLLSWKNILSNRPTGYGDTDIAEENPELKKIQKRFVQHRRKRNSDVSDDF